MTGYIVEHENAAVRPTLISRLAQSLSGTNLQRAGDYNQRIVLQSIRLREETTRVELAQQTGLTTPTIANITTRLIELDLVQNVGRTSGRRGQPSLKLRVNPDGAFGIGLNIDRDHLTLVALDLTGVVRARLTRETAFAMPEDVDTFVRENLSALLQDGAIDPDRVLGMGIAIPDDLGSIELPGRPPEYSKWRNLDLPGLFRGIVPWPIHRDNDAAAAALGEAQCATAFENPTFFYLLISAGLGGGMVIDRAFHRGATLRSGEIGLMPDNTCFTPGAVVQDTVSVSALMQRFADAGIEIGSVSDLGRNDPAFKALVDTWFLDATRSLAPPLMALSFLLNPDAVVIGGRLPLQFIKRLTSTLAKELARFPLPFQPRIMSAAMAADAPAIGGAMLPFLDRLLPSDAVLTQYTGAD